MPVSTPTSRGEDTISVIFDARDEVTPVVQEITENINGFKRYNISSSSGDLLGATKSIDASKKKLEDFSSSLKSTANVAEESGAKMSDAFAGGFWGGVVFDLVVNGLRSIKDEFGEVIDLAEEQPELFTDQQLQNVYAYNNAVGDFKDAWTDLKIQLVDGVLPALTDVALGLANTNDIRARANELVKEGYGREQALAQASRELNDATRDYTPTLEDNTDALKEQSKAFKGLLSAMDKIQSANEKFAEGEEDRANKIQDLEDKKAQAVVDAGRKREDIEKDIAELDRDIAKARRDSAYQLDRIDTDSAERAVQNAKTKEERNKALLKLEDARADAAQRRSKAEDDASERLHDLLVRRQELEDKLAETRDETAVKIVEYDEKIKGVEEDATKAVQDQEKARKELLFTMLEQKAAAESSAGGAEITKEEFEFLQNTKVELGLVDAASASTAIAISEDANTIWQSFQDATGSVNDVHAALQAVVAGSPYHVQIQIEQVGSIPSFGTNTITTSDRRRGQEGGLLGGGLSAEWLAQEITRVQTSR